MAEQQEHITDPETGQITTPDGEPVRIEDIPAGKPNWQPNYFEVYNKRERWLIALRKDPTLLRGMREYYRTRPAEFIEDWVDTYDPRNASNDMPIRMPFIMFPRQHEMLDFMHQCWQEQVDALIEKSRDVGASWLCCGYAIWMWMHVGESISGFGSRVIEDVDKKGDPGSLFEKMRQIIDGFPPEILPKGLDRRPNATHLTYMKISNPENGATIFGQGGANIGRGKRSSAFFKDESAHYAQPEMIEASLMETARCQIDISSVFGTGTPFHRKRESGVVWVPGAKLSRRRTNVFIFDWRDHPNKTQEWYDDFKAKKEAAGLEHVFAQEVDRNYSAAVTNIIIKPEWVNAAVDAHKKLGLTDTGGDIYTAGFDVAAEGIDLNAFAVRRGIVIEAVAEWGGKDVGTATREVVAMAKKYKNIDVHYDVAGLGEGVKAEVIRLESEKDTAGGSLMPAHVKFHSWFGGAKVLEPDKPIHKVKAFAGKNETPPPTNEKFYHNFKAQAWSRLRTRFYNTWQAVEQGAKYPTDELISISGDIEKNVLYTLKKELSQATRGMSSGTMKMLVEKKPDGTRSPNCADAVVMMFNPMVTSTYTLDNL